MVDVKDVVFRWSPWLFGNIEPLNEDLRGTKVTTMMRYLLGLIEDNEYVIVIRGPRGVGKTTALKWVTRRLIDSGKHVLFLGLDWSLYDQSFLRDAIDYFITEIVGSLPRTAKNVVIILDEIQNLGNWWAVVKEYYDLNKNIKFVVAGSNSSLLSSQAFSSLSHRAREVKFYPLKFSSILLHRAERSEINSDIVVPLRKGFERVIGRRYDKIEEWYRNLKAFRPVIKRELREYIRKGGYPSIVFRGYDPSFFSSILSEVVLKDMKARKPRKIAALLRRLANEKHDKTVEGISNDLGEKGSAGISNWLTGLENAGIIDIIYKFDLSGKSLKGRFKAYFVDRGMKNAVINNFGPLTVVDEENDAEAVVYDVLRRWAYKNHFNIWFWKDRKNREIDFVVENGKTGMLVESKYSNDPEFPPAHLPEGTEEFVRIVVSKDEFRAEGDVIVIPLWFFALFA